MQGVNVTFTAPASGASGTFGNGTPTVTVATNSAGIASAAFTANATAGLNYSVTASAGALNTTFTLSNLAGIPAKLTSIAGSTPQSATIGVGFLNPLAVTVTDGANNLLQGVSVTFTAPATGASGTFGNGTPSIAVSTNSAGIALVPFTANKQYVVSTREETT